MQQEFITALGPNDLDDGDQGRRQRGIAIAVLHEHNIMSDRYGYRVPSQSGRGAYPVSVEAGLLYCDCADFQECQKPCRCSSGATSDYRRNGRRRRSVHHGTLADHEVAVPAPSNWRVHLPVETIGLLQGSRDKRKAYGQATRGTPRIAPGRSHQTDRSGEGNDLQEGDRWHVPPTGPSGYPLCRLARIGHFRLAAGPRAALGPIRGQIGMGPVQRSAESPGPHDTGICRCARLGSRRCPRSQALARGPRRGALLNVRRRSLAMGAVPVRRPPVVRRLCLSSRQRGAPRWADAKGPSRGLRTWRSLLVAFLCMLALGVRAHTCSVVVLVKRHRNADETRHG